MQMDQKIIDQLCKNTIFEGLTQEQIADVMPCIAAAVRNYSSDECVYDKGETIRDLGVVLDGSLRICGEDVDGQQTTVDSVEKNQLFGEAVVFATGSSVPHRVIADKGAQVLYLSSDFFLSQCSKDCGRREAHEEIVKNMFRLLSDRSVMLSKQILYLTAPDLKTKIAMYLCELYELNRSETFNMPLNRDRLADFFSVARPSLSREFIYLKNLGVIDFYRSSVTILDANKLYKIAGSRSS